LRNSSFHRLQRRGCKRAARERFGKERQTKERVGEERRKKGSDVREEREGRERRKKNHNHSFSKSDY